MIYKDTDGREIIYGISYDENNKPVITITVSGKVIDYADKLITDAEGVARRMNSIDWLEYDNIDLTGIAFVNKDGEQVEFENNSDGSPITGTVKINFDLKAVESIQDVSPEDHVLAISPFKSPQIATGVVNRKGGKVAFIDGDVFQGPFDYTTGMGEVVGAHEFVTHLMGLEHKGGKSSLTKGSGVYPWSTGLEEEQVRIILFNLTNTPLSTPLNSGENKINSGKGGMFLNAKKKFTPTMIPNTVITNVKGTQIGNVKSTGVDTNAIIKKEKKIQKERNNKQKG